MAKNKKIDRKYQEKTESPAVTRSVASPRGGFSKRIAIILVAVLLIAGIVFFVVSLRETQNISFGKYVRYNVLLITLDTLRADRLPVYGYNRIETPHLDHLAEKSFIFQDAIAHVPLTVPSHASILTGRLPLAHGVRDNSGYFLDQKEITLAEILKKNGYATSAFVSAFVLDSRWQLDQGFDFYYDHFNLAEYREMNPRDVQRRAEETEIEVEHWLDKNKSTPFFLWVHFYDPHDPYDPPEPYKTEYPGRPYDGEIAYTDEIIGKLLKKVNDLGFMERTIVVVSGDHGEGLGEHNETTHAMFVYNTTQHVPLLIRVPGGKQQKIKGIVRHIDLAPTVLELVGIPPPDAIQGSSLISLLNGKDKVKRLAYSESIYAELHYGWSPLQSITTDEYKFINAPNPELYDRVNDPGETRNLISEKASFAKVLRSELGNIIAKHSIRDLKGPQKMDSETEEKLRALGYIGGTAVSTPESRKIDPKDKIHISRNMHQASGAASDKNYALALELLEPVLYEDPEMVDAHFIAGASYAGLGEYEKANDELLKTIRLKPDHVQALYNLGYSHEMMGDLKSAEFWYQQVLKIEEKHLFGSLKLAHIYRQMNQPGKAKSYFMAALKYYEESLENTKGADARSALHSTLGEIYFGAGDILKAEENFKTAISLAPDRPTLHYNLAQIYEAKRDLIGAIKEYRKEIEVKPSNYKAFNNLGILYKQLNRFDEAARCFEEVVELYPQDPRGYLLLASVYTQLGRNQEASKLVKLAQEKKIKQTGR